MIILDFETNTSNIHDVIEVAAFRVEKVDGSYAVKDTFHRYYHSPYELNPHALAVHKLTPERLERLRGDAKYSKYFKEDIDFVDFVDFCQGAETLVAHNISFELRHLGELVRFDKQICTMKENRQIVKVFNAKGNVKNPKLIETCDFYGIDFDDEQYHCAIYDVTKTLDILNAMD